jgi:hypothetical protein
VWDHPRPPAVKPCARRVRVEWAGEALADSIRALRVLETTHPRRSIYSARRFAPQLADRQQCPSDVACVQGRSALHRCASYRAPDARGRLELPGSGRWAMRRCAIMSRSIPVARMPHGLTTSAAARGGRLHCPHDARAGRREADVGRRAAAFVGRRAAGSPRFQSRGRGRREDRRYGPSAALGPAADDALIVSKCRRTVWSGPPAWGIR